MPNWCYSKYAFYANKEHESELIRLHKNISDIFNNPSSIDNDFEPGWIGKIAIAHGLNYKDYSCRGTVYQLADYISENCYFILEIESAWAPPNDLWEAVIKLYDGIAFVYMAEELGMEILINTDIDQKYFPERYLLDVHIDDYIPSGWHIEDDIHEYFADFDTLKEYCTKLIGQSFNTLEEINTYFSKVTDDDKYLYAIAYKFVSE